MTVDKHERGAYNKLVGNVNDHIFFRLLNDYEYKYIYGTFMTRFFYQNYVNDHILLEGAGGRK